MKILQIVDSSVIYYTFHHSSRVTDFSQDTELHNSIVEFIDSGGLYPFANTQSNITSVWLIDSKPYWKSMYEPEYKSHRRRPLIQNENALYLNTIKSKASHLAFDQFEADDIAGAIARLPLDQYDRVFFLTVDSDWLGLLDKEGKRYCINPCGNSARVKNAWSAFQWYTSKYQKESEKRKKESPYRFKRWSNFVPSEIFLYKTAFGDVSDNLPQGTCRGLIDLLNPVTDYDLLNYPEYANHILDIVQNTDSKPITGSQTFLNYYRKWGDTPLQSCTVNDFTYATTMLSTAQGAMI